jgi:flagellar biosynthesis protein
MKPAHASTAPRPSHALAPRRRAAALRYETGCDRAPRVVASGQGHIADRILALAHDHGVPVQHDPALAAALAQLELDREIPPQLFAAVAEVIGFLYRMQRR